MVTKKKTSVAQKSVKKTSANKKIAIAKSYGKGGRVVAKIKSSVSVVTGWTKNHKSIAAVALATVLVVGSVPTYRYATQKIADNYEASEGYNSAVLSWLKIVMTRQPNQKIKLEGDILKIYNDMKYYAVKIADIYPSLRNLQVKASVLTPVDQEGAIATYRTILNRAGKCAIYTPKINAAEKNNYRYFFEIARLYVRMDDKKSAMENIDIALEKAGKDLSKEIIKSMKETKAAIEKMPATPAVKTPAKK